MYTQSVTPNTLMYIYNYFNKLFVNKKYDKVSIDSY